MKLADRRGRDEAGAYLVLYALLASALFVIAAFVLDITALRQDRRANRLTSDAAATAGAAQLDTTGTRGQAACDAAWNYFLANRADRSGTISAPDCTRLAQADPCAPDSSEREALGSAGGLEVTIVNPVPNDHPMMLGEAPGGDLAVVTSASHDGDPCLRLGVGIRRTRDLSFAGIAGLRSVETDVHSVARPDEPQPTGRAPALIVLDPTGCDTLTTTGNGTLRAMETLADGSIVPGVLTVDTDANACGARQYAIRPDPGTGIFAGTAGTPGLIRSYATFVGAPGKYNGGDIPTRLWPEPTAAPRTGRGDVDSRYGSAITNLKSTLGGGGVPAGFVDTISGAECTWTSPIPRLFTSNLYVDCDTFTVPAGSNALLWEASDGPTKVVFRGAVRVQESGCLAVNSDCAGVLTPTQSSVVYIRSGGLTKESRGALSLPKTLVFLADGILQLNGGTGAVPGGLKGLRWSPHEGDPFNYLSFWSESSGTATIAAQNEGFGIGGLFFAPETSRFLLQPRPGNNPPLDAQFVVNRFGLDGGNQPIVVGPDRTRAVQDTVRLTRLIR